MSTFAQRTEHFHASNEPTRCLFLKETRPKALSQIYDAAAAAAVRSLDSLRRDVPDSAMDLFVCTPILSKRAAKRRDQSLDIESRVPRAIEDLRRWTSAEALGDVTVAPDCASRILADSVDDSQPVDHKLPSPEEQVQAVALKFPAEVVAVDVSGRGFRRMSMHRRSLHAGLQEPQQQETVRRRSRTRRPRGKRRNTIAGTDHKEIRQAVVGEIPADESQDQQQQQQQSAHGSAGGKSKRAYRSASTDLLETKSKDTPAEKKSHFNTLKAWGRSRLRLISPKSAQASQQHMDNLDVSSISLTPTTTSSRPLSPEDEILDANDAATYVKATNRRSYHERKPSSSSSSGNSNVSTPKLQQQQQLQKQLQLQHQHQQQQQQQQQQQLQRQSLVPKVLVNGQTQDQESGFVKETASASSSTSSNGNGNVKLRESAAERRERRKASSKPDEPPHSSSGNWSASSESGRASIGSETTTATTHQPRSTTTASIGTSSNSLSQARRLKNRDNSASSSVTSEGTLTPDIIQDINVVPFSDDGETSSVYSCDTEGYYTSFHVDSGLKTLREEEPASTAASSISASQQHLLQPVQALTKTNEVQSEPASPCVENEYELFGRGSTSTTTSSAGTVCTTLLAPPPPERKSSLTVVAIVHGGAKKNGGESPDSGHNTSSSPVESASSPACTGRSCSEFEYSESSDLEGCERIERIRSKTACTTSRIPSMCVITPPGSDDEQSHREQQEQQQQQQQSRSKKDRPKSNVLMSATVGSSKMEVINGQDKNLYATVQTVPIQVREQQPVTSQSTYDKGLLSIDSLRDLSMHAPVSLDNFTVPPAQALKTSPLSSVLGKLRTVLSSHKQQQQQQVKSNVDLETNNLNNNRPPLGANDLGDYVTIADVRNNNDKRTSAGAASSATYANADLFKRDAEYVSLSELPRKQDSSLERRRQGARVTLDSEGKVVYSSDSLKRRKAAHTTFIPGPFVKEGSSSPGQSPILRRAQVVPRAVIRTGDTVDAASIKPTIIAETPKSSIAGQAQQQLGKLIIRAAKSPERSVSPDYVRTPTTVVGPTPTSATTTTTATPLSSIGAARLARQGAYVNVQGSEEKPTLVSQVAEQSNAATACQHQQPPPYIGPPQVTYADNRLTRPRHPVQTQLPSATQLQQKHQQQIQPHNIHPYQLQANHLAHQHPHHPHHLVYEFDPQYQRLYSNYADNQRILCQNQFFTLPNRKSQREVIDPPRSITPDITRGLVNSKVAVGSLSAVHMLARQEQKNNVAEKLLAHHHQGQMSMHAPCQAEQHLQQQQQRRMSPVDMKNRFASPHSLSAVGYRLFASPGLQQQQQQQQQQQMQQHQQQYQENLKNAPFSPIGPEHSNGIRTSTPTLKNNYRALPSVAERLALQSQRCASPNPALLNYSDRSDSGKNTPTSLLLSPIKSTMSNEELFAVIHKSKKRLNIREDGESLSPANSIGSLSKGQQMIGTRHSWSPESQKTPEIPKTILAPLATSRMDFKRLLLQQSIKVGPTRISAAEQLKLSRQQQLQEPSQQTASPIKHTNQQIPLNKVMSPRSAWRFQTPRTDVLSSTIIEDAAAEEKAMKPSPETPYPVTKLPPVSTNSRRQLDMADENKKEELTNVLKESKKVTNQLAPSRPLMKNEKELENRLQAIDDNPIKAIENRRISNQLARAQFLAGNSATSAADNNPKDLFGARFRARSESPQQNAHQHRVLNSGSPSSQAQQQAASAADAIVSRSPSAPALETAL
uniref:WASP family protein member n=1 Tax=Trichogramma kaykai TaxID=54128 RepID=A0ABD2X8Z5_9HYME